MNDSAREVKNIKIMVEFSPIKNFFEGLLSFRLLLLGFVITNTILGLELPKKTSLPNLKSLMANIFLQSHESMNLSYHELEVKDCGNVELECLNFKLQKPKVVRGGIKWTTY